MRRGNPSGDFRASPRHEHYRRSMSRRHGSPPNGPGRSDRHGKGATVNERHDKTPQPGRVRNHGLRALSTAVAGAAWCAFALTPAAHASDRVCVICEAPDAQYSCTYAPETGGGLGALKYRCLREVAETYGHRQCKVNDTPLSDCAGTVHMLTAAPPAAPPQPAETGDAAPAKAPEGQPPGAVGEGGGEPKTVVELAKRTAKTTQRQIEKSGETVEGMARQAWRCVTSLFARCAPPEAPDGRRSPADQ
jgi:hypothetical protein